MPNLGTIVDFLVVLGGWAIALGCFASARNIELAAKNYPPEALEYLRKYGL